MRNKKCRICNKEFIAKHPAIMICSDECRKEARKKHNRKFYLSNKSE